MSSEFLRTTSRLRPQGHNTSRYTLKAVPDIDKNGYNTLETKLFKTMLTNIGISSHRIVYNKRIRNILIRNRFCKYMTFDNMSIKNVYIVTVPSHDSNTPRISVVHVPTGKKWIVKVSSIISMETQQPYSDTQLIQNAIRDMRDNLVFKLKTEELEVIKVARNTRPAPPNKPEGGSSILDKFQALNCASLPDVKQMLREHISIDQYYEKYSRMSKMTKSWLRSQGLIAGSQRLYGPVKNFMKHPVVIQVAKFLYAFLKTVSSTTMTFASEVTSSIITQARRGLDYYFVPATKEPDLETPETHESASEQKIERQWERIEQTVQENTQHTPKQLPRIRHRAHAAVPPPQLIMTLDEFVAKYIRKPIYTVYDVIEAHPDHLPEHRKRYSQLQKRMARTTSGDILTETSAAMLYYELSAKNNPQSFKAPLIKDY